jgi:hypothetical protein
VAAQKVKALPVTPLVVAAFRLAVPLARPGCQPHTRVEKFPPTTPLVAGKTAPALQTEASATGGRQPAPPATKLHPASSVAGGGVGAGLPVRLAVPGVLCGALGVALGVWLPVALGVALGVALACAAPTISRTLLPL